MLAAGGRIGRVEPRRRVRAFVLGLVAELPRKNCRVIAGHAGDRSPDGMQHLLARAKWDTDGVRDDVRVYVVRHLGDPGAVLVVDETGDVRVGGPPRDGRAAAVHRHGRQDRELAGRRLSTAAWSSARTGRQAADRSAATATDRASFGSFLFTFPLASSRTRAASLGGTSSTPPRRRPAAGRAGAPGRRRPPPPRSAPARTAAQASSCRACAALARTRTWPSTSSALPIATAVCDPLCGSTPIITAAIGCPSSSSSADDPGRARLISDRSAVGPLSSHPRQDPTGRHLVLKPGQARQAVRDPAHRTPQTLRPTSQRFHEQLGGSRSLVSALQSPRAAGRPARYALQTALTRPADVTPPPDGHAAPCLLQPTQCHSTDRLHNPDVRTEMASWRAHRPTCRASRSYRDEPAPAVSVRLVTASMARQLRRRPPRRGREPCEYEAYRPDLQLRTGR